MGAIRAELARDSDYTCNGIAARTVAGLAAKLIEIGHDPVNGSIFFAARRFVESSFDRRGGGARRS